MAAATSPTPTTAPTPQVFHTRREASRQEIQAAIAKAVELRALHAALVQGNSPAANLRFTTSPVSRPPAPQLTPQDYPVFTPSYEDEAEVPNYQQIHKSRTASENWEDYDLGGGGSGNDVVLSHYRKGLTCGLGLVNLDQSHSHICPADDHKSMSGSCTNHITVLQTSPGTDRLFKSSRRNSLGDFKSISSCNKCRPAMVVAGSDNASRTSKNSNIVVPLTDSHASLHSQPKAKGMILSRWFTKLKKKNKQESSPNRAESEEASQILKDLGILSIESLKKELTEANENRDAALMEVAEMKSSLGDLKNKLEYLESYCEELKKALRKTKDREVVSNVGRRGKSIDGNVENNMPVSEEVMVEGFLQIVSEARLSVKQFCKTLVGQIEETDSTLMDSINSLLNPHKVSLSSKHTKAVLYHLEAIINQSLYQDFENCVFQKNGSPKFLDPNQDRQAQFASFVALRNLSWNEVLRKGTKYYSEEFSKFCDQKMSCIITALNWTRPWPEQLLQSFFVAAKCIWLLHLLAFSFNPALGILRVEENRGFDGHYMEDMLMDRQRLQGTSKVKVMVMPGFYVQDRVLRCKVVCSYKSVT